MKKFNKFIIESNNSHMEHLEDNVLNRGVDGAREAINFIQSLRDMLAGKSDNRVNVSVKWDGSPAVFAGVDPSDGKFYVAKKSIFNTTPKVYKTPKDVKKDTTGDLQKKMLKALQQLPKLGITDICVQGDFLYDKSDLEYQDIEKNKFITFHPNTILYAVPANTPLGKTIKKSEIGIVWHTTYTGDSFQTMKASFGKTIASRLKKTPSVWSVDAVYQDVSGRATMTFEETSQITAELRIAGQIFRKIKAKYLNNIKDSEEVKKKIKTFLNSYIREGQSWPTGMALSQAFLNYITEYYNKEIAKRKTPKGKAGVEEKKKEFMKVLADPISLANVFNLMQKIVVCKHYIIGKMNEAGSLRTFLKTKNGYKVTGQEGFVAIDRIGNNAVKLVDRLEFSYANFSPDILKGWQR